MKGKDARKVEEIMEVEKAMQDWNKAQEKRVIDELNERKKSKAQAKKDKQKQKPKENKKGKEGKKK